MFEEIERLTRALCAEHGTSGCEGDVFKVAKKELGFCKEVCENELGDVVGIFGDLSSKRRILLDAHIDQIGMIVTDIDENGFLHVTNVGGVDRRTLPGSDTGDVTKAISASPSSSAWVVCWLVSLRMQQRTCGCPA